MEQNKNVTRNKNETQDSNGTWNKKTRQFG